MADLRCYYVYELIDPRDGKVFYVGKGKGRRVERHAKDAKSGRVSNPAKYSRIKSILDGGYQVVERVVKSGLNEREAFALERRMILDGRENLTNISMGSYSGDDILLEHAKIGVARCEQVLRGHDLGQQFPDGWVEVTSQWLAVLNGTVARLEV